MGSPLLVTDFGFEIAVSVFSLEVTDANAHLYF